MEAENKRKCRICNVCCSSIVQLCEHVTGSKHKIKLSLTAPHEVKRLGTIQLFLDMHMKAEPILGLEYIVETMVDAAYVYNCQLCEVKGDWRMLIGHLVDSVHMTRYIDKHYPELSLGEKTYPRKGEHLRALREISKKIVKSTLRKSIQAYKPGSSDPNAVENAKGEEKRDDSQFKSDDDYEEKSERAASPKESAAAEARRRVARKRAPLRSRADIAMAAKVARLSVAARRNGALAAKRAILEEQSRPELREFEREPDWSLSIQELEFRRNQDLLNYLRNYKIECDGDAHYIQQIIRNCTDALCRFREQQAREESLQTPLPLPRSQPVAAPYGYSGWNRPEGQGFPVNRMDPYPSGSRAPMPRQAPYPIRSPFPPSAATEIFFNSIKNMEEGEVVNVFHKIAATNPAFRGINIPSVIRYLKDTGRLKP